MRKNEKTDSPRR